MKIRLTAAAVAVIALAACGNEDPDDPRIAPVMSYTVIDYSPAPGQFVNEIPRYYEGDDAAAMASRAEEIMLLRGAVSLGAFGGSITLKFSQSVPNHDGADLRVLGNAYFAGTDIAGRQYGSSEPGIVYVMCDDNGNGQPDDVWYELRGEGYEKSVADVEVTYHRPAADATDAQYIYWTASDGSEGYINRVSSYHRQDFFARWMGAGNQTFRGRRLPDNGVLDSATGFYRLYNVKGYADAYPNTSDESKLDISAAVDAAGKSVKLDKIDFMRIVTGVLQANGNLGECSTEVAGIEFL